MGILNVKVIIPNLLSKYKANSTLIVYVDDIVVTRNDDTEVKLLKVYLAKEFEIKDLGQVRYFWVLKLQGQREAFFYLKRSMS